MSEIPDRVYIADLSGEGDLVWTTKPFEGAGVEWVEFRRTPESEQGERIEVFAMSWDVDKLREFKDEGRSYPLTVNAYPQRPDDVALTLARTPTMEEPASPTICPGCGGYADNGHDRSDPPQAYYCTRCEATREEPGEPEPRIGARITGWVDGKPTLEPMEGTEIVNGYLVSAAPREPQGDSEALELVEKIEEALHDVSGAHATTLLDHSGMTVESALAWLRTHLSGDSRGRETPAGWSDAPPTEPGWYWLEEAHDVRPVLLMPGPDGTLWGDDGSWAVDEVGGRWCLIPPAPREIDPPPEDAARGMEHEADNEE